MRISSGCSSALDLSVGVCLTWGESQPPFMGLKAPPCSGCSVPLCSHPLLFPASLLPELQPPQPPRWALRWALVSPGGLPLGTLRLLFPLWTAPSPESCLLSLHPSGVCSNFNCPDSLSPQHPLLPFPALFFSLGLLSDTVYILSIYLFLLFKCCGESRKQFWPLFNAVSSPSKNSIWHKIDTSEILRADCCF